MIEYCLLAASFPFSLFRVHFFGLFDTPKPFYYVRTGDFCF